MSHHAPTTEGVTTPPTFIAIRPWGNSGWKVHLTEDRPKDRAKMGLGNLVLRAIPLCRRKVDGTRREGARYSDHLIVGGVVAPTPWREAVEKAMPSSYVCEECVLRAEKRGVA